MTQINRGAGNTQALQRSLGSTPGCPTKHMEPWISAPGFLHLTGGVTIPALQAEERVREAGAARAVCLGTGRARDRPEPRAVVLPKGLTGTHVFARMQAHAPEP